MLAGQERFAQNLASPSALIGILYDKPVSASLLSLCVCASGLAGTLPEEEEGGLAVGWIVMITLLGAAALVVLASLVWWGYRSGFGRRKTGGGWEYAGKIRSFPDVRTYRSQAYDPDEIDGYGITAYDPTPSTAHSRNSSMGFESGSGMPGGQSAGSPGSNSSTAAAFARKFGRSLSECLRPLRARHSSAGTFGGCLDNPTVHGTCGACLLQGLHCFVQS